MLSWCPWPFSFSVPTASLLYEYNQRALHRSECLSSLMMMPSMRRSLFNRLHVLGPQIYIDKTSEDKLKTLQCAMCQNISVKRVVLNCVDGADAHHFGSCCFARIYPKGLYVRLSSKQTK